MNDGYSDLFLGFRNSKQMLGTKCRLYIKQKGLTVFHGNKYQLDRLEIRFEIRNSPAPITRLWLSFRF